MMKKNILFYFFWIAWLGLSGQTTASTVISSAGDSFKSANAELSWTLGESIIETLTANNAVLTQGFHQTNLIITSVEELGQKTLVKVFPNPVGNIANIEVKEGTGLTHLQLVDLQGRSLINRSLPLAAGIEQLDLSQLPAGSYYLRLLNATAKTIQTLKIVKLK